MSKLDEKAREAGEIIEANTIFDNDDGTALVNVDGLLADIRAYLAAAPAPEPVTRKQFPVLSSGGQKIDYQLVADHGEQAKNNHYQTVERLSERGGLSWSELYAVLHNKPWAAIDTNEALLACRGLEAKYLAALASPPAPPVLDVAVKAWLVNDFHVARMPVKARGKFPESTEYLYPASREEHAKDTARMMGGTCTPLYASPPAPPAPEPVAVKALEWKRPDEDDWQARTLVAEANSSLYGSQGYFHSTNGGPFDKYHLARPIEDLKALARRMLAAEAERDEAREDVQQFMDRLDARWFLDQGWFPSSKEP